MGAVFEIRKVSFFLLFFFLVGVNISTAQIAVIPEVGLNLSKIKYDSTGVETVPLTGYQIGANLRIGGGGFLQVGVFYHQYANRFEWTDSSGVQSQTNITIDGVLIPIQFGFSVYNADMLKVRLMAGINVGIPTGMKPNDFNLTKDGLKGSNVEIAVGFGFDIYRFIIDANFGFAMNDLFNDPSKNSGKNLYSLNVGYLIGKK
jgi:hypothetical protein